MTALSKPAHRIQTRLLPLVVVALVATSSSCMTNHCVWENAMSHETFDVKTCEDKIVPGRPGYYALLPLTVAADLVTGPFQLIYYSINSSETHFNDVTIYGVPIPLP
jgi:hypothetical protein